MRCKQPATPPVSKAPAADQWIDESNGLARLSEAAATWVTELLGTIGKERSLRKREHDCLDEHEAKGLIRQ